LELFENSFILVIPATPGIQ